MTNTQITHNVARGEFIKHYTDRARFDCELHYNRFFAEAGFTVPRIRWADEAAQTIAFTCVEGASPHQLTAHQLELCLEQLIHISQMPVPVSDGEVTERYLATFEARYRQFMLNSGRTAGSQALALLHAQLRPLIWAGWFKDAKPTNWRFTPDGRVWLLDFDYVVPSLGIADMSKLLLEQTSLTISEKLAMCASFAQSIGGRASRLRPEQLEQLFHLATVQSALSVLAGQQPVPAARANHLIAVAETSLHHLELLEL